MATLSLSLLILSIYLHRTVHCEYLNLKLSENIYPICPNSEYQSYKEKYSVLIFMEQQGNSGNSFFH